jgi:septal ring-binding cell division protein DamX
MRIEKMASKTDAIAKLVIVFFISLLSFSIGTFVGKNYSDNQHQLAALEPSKAEKTERSVASVNEEGNSKPGAMTDEEIAKLAEEFVSDETAPTGHGEEAAEGAHGAVAAAGHGETAHGAPAHGATATSAKNETGHGAPAAATGHEAATEKADAKSEAHAPRAAAPKGHVTGTEASSTAKNLAAGKAPTNTENKAATKTATPEERRPSSLPKDVAAFSVGKFTVQVASYPDEAEAQKHASELKDKGYSAFYVPANIKGKTYYRVSVGQFATQKEAQSYRAEFIGKAKVGSAIVQKITE